MKLGAPTQIFILRCWQVYRDERPQWHYRLEIPSTDEAYLFTSLESLMHFLEARLGTPSSNASEGSGT